MKRKNKKDEALMNRYMHLTIFTAIILWTAFNPTHAGEVTLPNTFEAGTPAVAADVNENFTAVKTAVDDNAAGINTNASRIDTNASQINTNATEIDANASAISDNADDITTNTANISANNANISANGAGISANTANIASHEVEITANTADIDSHRSSIYSHQQRLSRAHGYVNRYFLDDIHGSSNVSSVTWNATYDRYEIEVDGFSYGPHNHATVVNPSGDYSRFATVSSVGGRLLVYIHDETGSPVQSSFFWVTFAY